MIDWNYDEGWQHGISYATHMAGQWAESEGLRPEQLAGLLARLKEETTEQTPGASVPHADAGAENLNLAALEIDL